MKLNEAMKAMSAWPHEQFRERAIGTRSAWWKILVFALAIFVLQPGCRTLRDRSSSQQLQQARQLSLKGTDAIERQRYTDAEMLFFEALKQSEKDDRAHWGYANALWIRGEKSKAIEHMTEALRLSERSAGRNPEYAIRLGEMCLEVGDFTQARSIAERVLAEKRHHAAAWALVGDTHKAERKWEVAQECYQRALLIQPDYPKVQLSLAEVYRHMRKPQRALAVVDRMIDVRDTASLDPYALLNRGLALADLNRHDEAKELLAKASERLPHDQLQSHLEIVHAQHRIGELVAARMTLGRIRESHAASVEVQRLQSMLDLSFAHLSDPLSPALIQDPAGLDGWSKPALAGDSTLKTLPVGDSGEPPAMVAQPFFNAQPWVLR